MTDGPRLDHRRHAEATDDNKDDLLAVLQRVLPASGLVLEVASGTGQHAAFFGPRLPGRVWQPTDPDAGSRASVDAWARHEQATSVRPALALDAASDVWPVTKADAVVCVNMIHIAPWTAGLGLLRGAARVLPPGGPLVLYGPYRVDGVMAESNRDFDGWLRARDPRWGVREVADVEAAAKAVGLAPDERIAMPWDNLVVVLRRS